MNGTSQLRSLLPATDGLQLPSTALPHPAWWFAALLLALCFRLGLWNLQPPV